MLRWIAALAVAGAAGLSAQSQSQSDPQTQSQSQAQTQSQSQTQGQPGLQKKRPPQPTGAKEEIPPEEDSAVGEKTYSFNPLQAQKEVQTGLFYFKKGSYRAAENRFKEATLWNNGYDEAWLRLGETEEKLRDRKAARDAYQKYVEVTSDQKKAAEVRKKIDHLK
jgi:tetratricopeptide (TPR) repeat protein